MSAASRQCPRALELLAASGGLVAYNGALNLVPCPPAAYVPANLGLASAAVWGLGRRWGLRPRDLGLNAAGLRRGLLAGGTVAGGAVVLLRLARTLPRARGLFEDQRAAGLGGAVLAYQALVRIPLGTALTEEVLFRGVLEEGFARRLPPLSATVAANAVFGLWHLGPTLRLLEANDVDLGRGGTALALAGSVVATAAAGIGFALLRRWSGSLAAPVLAHAGTNVASLLAAVAQQRASRPAATAARSPCRSSRTRRSARGRPPRAARR